jgi:hypothetical protein
LFAISSKQNSVFFLFPLKFNFSNF